MAITITIAQHLSDHQFLEVQKMVWRQRAFDPNFFGRLITIERGAVTAVFDPQDEMRGALLMTMVVHTLDSI